MIVPTPSPTVIVQTGSGNGGDLVEHLAAHILSAPNSVVRSERERVTEKFLREVIPEGKREGLARALDEKIAAKSGTATPQTALKRAVSWLTGGGK